MFFDQWERDIRLRRMTSTVVTSICRRAVASRADENPSLCLTLQQQWLCLEAQHRKSTSAVIARGYHTEVRTVSWIHIVFCVELQ